MDKRYSFVIWLVLVTPLTIVSAQERNIIGKVTDIDSMPLAGANVTIKGTNRGTTTNSEGLFFLKVTPGSRLVVSGIGYTGKEVFITSSLTVVDISLADDVANLDEVVITGLALTIKRSNAANAVDRLNAEDLVGRTRPPTVDAAMSGKIMGANIVANSGAPGGGFSVKLRGISSIVGNSEPLYVVDGIIIDNSQFNTGAGTRAFNGAVAAANVGPQDQAPNRIADLNPADIESIDVLKGPSASAIYGTRANAGVIVITTKRGQSGKTLVRVSQDLGISQAANLLKSEEWTEDKIHTFGGFYGVDVPTALKIFREAKGQTWDFDKLIFGETGRLSNTNISLRGGNEHTRFFISAGLNQETGIVKNTGFGRRSLRANIDHTMSRLIDVKVSSSYLSSTSSRSFLGNDNNGVSLGYQIAYIPNFLDLTRRADGTYPESPGTGQNPFEIRDRMENKEFTNRFLQSGEVNLNLFNRDNRALRLSLRGGLDFLLSQPRVYAPEDLQYQKRRANPGASRYGNNKALYTYLQAFLTYNWKAGSVDLTSQVGGLRNVQTTDLSWIQGEGLLPGQRNPSTAAVRIVDAFLTKSQDVAADVSQEFNWQDRVIGRMGVRFDKSSLNGDNTKWYAFPRASLAVNLTKFRFFNSSIISQLKPRVAFGQTGGVPQWGDIYTTMISGVYDSKLALLPPITNGNPGLNPERAQELEFGVDVGLLGNRFVLEATAYHKSIFDFLLQYNLAPATGVNSIARYPVGDLTNKGIEVGLTANLVRKSNLVWTTTVQYWHNRSRVSRLIVPPQFFPSGFANYGRGRLVEGYSPTLWWGRNEKGESPVPFQDNQPRYQLSWSNSIRFLKNFDFSMLWHTSQGNHNSTMTHEHKDEGGTTADWSTPIILADGKQTVVGLGPRVLGKPGYSTQTFIRNASYIRLREIGLYYSVPKRAYTRLLGNGIGGIRLGTSAQNLLTFSDYLNYSYDPEASNFGNRFVMVGVDLAPYPAARRMFFHVTLDF